MKTRNGCKSTILGLACVAVTALNLAVQAQPVGTNQIALTDYDNVGSVGYGYFYSWGWDTGGGTQYTNGTWGNVLFSDPLIPIANGPMVLQYSFTNAAFSELMTTNAANSGYGTGFGSGVSWDFDGTKFTSLNLEDYIISWDARVEGLKPGQTTANCQMEFRLNSSLVDPPLPNNRVLQKNIGYNPGSNWTHYVFTLDQGNWAEGTSYQTFTNGIVASITGIEFNQNQHGPDAQFGFDEDNAIYVDNIKLEVITYAGPPPPPPPTVPFTVLDWNLDDKPLWWGSGGWNWSQNSYLPVGAYSYGTNMAGTEGYVNTNGVGGSSGWVLWMTNTDLASPNTPQWAGIGMNGGGPITGGLFTSGNLADYVFSFACRAEGVAGANAGAMAAVVLNAPDDTVQPPDADTGEDRLIRLNFNLPATANWQTLVYKLKEGGVDSEGGSSMSRFTTYYDKVSSVMLQWQINNANSEATWGFDADNLLVIDNPKLERLIVGCPPLNVAVSGDNLVVTWAAPTTGSTKLQGATNVGGPYTEVVGATSPYTTPKAGGPKYFRTFWVPPSP